MNLRFATALAAIGALSEIVVQLLSQFAFDIYHALSDSLNLVFIIAPFTYLLFFATLFFKQGGKKE